MALATKDNDHLRDRATERGVTLTEFKDELLTAQAEGLRNQKANEWWVQLTLDQKEAVFSSAIVDPK